MNRKDLYNRLIQLSNNLVLAIQGDSEQEVTGIAEPVLDALVSEARKYLQNDPVVEKMHDVISVQRIDLGNPVRALDALIVVNQLIAALGDPNA